MSRKKRRRPVPAGPRPETKWNWISFPVFFAFTLGMFVAALLFALGYAGWFAAFAIGLFGLSFGAAHMITRPIARRRAQRQQQHPEGNA